jgi:tight adherence protein C
MNPAAVALLSFAIVAGATFLAAYLVLRRWPTVERSRFTATGGGADPQAHSILRFDSEFQSRWQRIAARLGEALGPGDRERRSQYRRKLVQAGYHDPRAVTILMGAKVGLALAAFCAYPVYGFMVARVLPNLLSISGILAAVGFFFPDYWLRRRRKQRQKEVVEALPDVLDLLMVCVEAGMGFDAAVARIAESVRKPTPLHQEMMRMHLEIRAGRPREEAMRDWAERTGVDEVKRIVTAFTQADRLGTPLGKTLRVHAEAARVDRRHRAEAKAYMAPLKMIFPTALFLMPAFMLVAMAPALLNLLKLFSGLGCGD